MTKAQDKALGALLLIGLIIGLPIYFVVKLGETIGWPWFAAGLACIVVGYLGLQAAQASARKKEQAAQEAQHLAEIAARRAALLQKYGNAELVEKIMQQRIWQGQTSEQLEDSLGAPADVDERVYKTKTKHVWKYHPAGANRFALRITLEGGSVVGWDEKL